MKQISEQHSIEVVASFSSLKTKSQPYQPVHDCIERKGNAHIGVTRKSYFGQRLNGSCSC